MDSLSGSEAGYSPRPAMRPPDSRTPVDRDQVVELVIDAQGDGGDGLARVDGYVVFVREALLGERVRARIVSAGAKNGRAEVLQILQAAPERVEPRCSHYGACGGCQLQHLRYDAQLTNKRGRLAKALTHALRREVAVPEVLAPEDPFGQRSKVVLHVERQPSGYRSGLYAYRSRRLIALDECPAADPRGFELARRAVAVCESLRVPAWDAKTGRGAMRGVMVRTTQTGERGLVVISAEEALPREQAVVTALVTLGATGIWVNHNPTAIEEAEPLEGAAPAGRVDAFETMHLLGSHTRPVHGQGWLTEEVAGLRYLTSPDAFFQTSKHATPVLVEQVVAMLDAPADATIVDAYCGGGLFALVLAKRVGKVIGIEDSRAAVADAERSAKANGITNVRFEVGPAQHLLPRLRKERPFGVVLDPPRAGAHAGVLETIVTDLRPHRIVYVACDIGSLARDAALLERAEYSLTRLQPIDMFPLTHHLEVVACFERNPQIRDGKKTFSKSAGQRLLAKARKKPGV